LRDHRSCVDVYEDGDVAEAQAYLEAEAESEEYWDNYHIKLQADNQAVSFARVEREGSTRMTTG